MRYADRVRQSTARSDRFGSMRPQQAFKDHYRAVSASNIQEGKYPFRLIPPSPQKWPQMPAVIVKHRIEIVKGERPKWKLGADSFYDNLSLGDPPIMLDRLLLGLQKLCWKIVTVERNGKKIKIGDWDFPPKLAKIDGFIEAINLVMPMRAWAAMVLTQGRLEEIRQDVEPGKKEWKKYRLLPSDRLPIEEWVPIMLEWSAVSLTNGLLEAIDTAESFNQSVDVWDRRKGANFILVKGKNSYEVRAKANKGVEIPVDVWKELLNERNYPNLKRKLQWMTKDEASTDDQIINDLEESWWFGKLLKYVPEIADYLDGEHDSEFEEEEESDSDDDDDDGEYF